MRRDELRRAMRETRRAIPAGERAAAAAAAVRVLTALDAWRDAERVAVYHPMDGELDPAPLTAAARAAGKQVYLPVLNARDDEPMVFLPWNPDTPLAPNRYRIPEPVTGAPLAAQELDLVLAPLVAFDLHGQRLGMGAGFYDRSFAFLKDTRITRPLLLGFAYACQRVDALPPEPWDVPLAGVATEQQMHHFKG